jgi:hypothetical protein
LTLANNFIAPNNNPREQVENHRRASTQVLFLPKAELGFFHFFEIVTGWKIPVQPGWYLPPQEIQLAENKFLHAGKGAKNTKEKSRSASQFQNNAS